MRLSSGMVAALSRLNRRSVRRAGFGAVALLVGAWSLGGCGGSGGGGGAVTTPAGEIVVFQSDREGQFELYVMNGDGTGQTRLTNSQNQEQDPVFSRDARRIAYVVRTGGSTLSQEIFVANADGSSPVRVTNNNFVDDRPSFSPDGTKLVFRSSRPDTQQGGLFLNSDIYIINIDGTGEQRLTTNTGRDLEPAFTPDGRILYAREQPGNVSGIFRIARINSDGSRLSEFTAGPDDSRPSARRDGGLIAYTSRPTPGADTEIFVMNAEGGNETRLTNLPGAKRAPVFSPDGRRIYFSWQAGANADIYVINADGSNAANPIRLTTHFQTDTVPDVR